MAATQSSGDVLQQLQQAIDPIKLPQYQRLLDEHINKDKHKDKDRNTAIQTSSSINNEALSLRINRMYLPVYQYIKSNYQSHRKKHQEGGATRSDKKEPLFIGISAPQGCGKTTLTDSIQILFEEEGLSCVVMSLDDFYLTGSAQEQLALENSQNSLLRFRGNAGTHDLPLLYNTLNALISLEEDGNRNTTSSSSSSSSSSGGVALVPRFNKALRSGKGDRAPEDEWVKVTAKWKDEERGKGVDIVLVEGWMFGFQSRTEAEEAALDNRPYVHEGMKSINEFLREYRPLHEMMDAWVVIAIDSVSSVYKWREEAEEQLRFKSDYKTGLTKEQVVDFVDRFMPAYDTYLPSLYKNGPERRSLMQSKNISNTSSNTDSASAFVPVLKLAVDQDRRPLTGEFM